MLEIVGSQSLARQCLIVAIQHKPESGISATKENGLWQLETPASLFNGPADEVKFKYLDKVIIGDDPEKFFQVGAQLPPQEREQLVKFLRRNVDVFAWDAYEAPWFRPKIHLSSFECEPLSYSKKAATSAPF